MVLNLIKKRRSLRFAQLVIPALTRQVESKQSPRKYGISEKLQIFDNIQDRSALVPLMCKLGKWQVLVTNIRNRKSMKL